MKYKVFLTDSIEVLKNEQLIGEAETYQEASQILKQAETRAAENKYWRLLLGETATFIDYGSWSQFAAIIPPIDLQEIMKGNIN